MTISNNTSNAVLPYSVGIYLSDNATLNGDDELLDSQSFGILEGQSTVNTTFNVTLANSLTPGDYS